MASDFVLLLPKHQSFVEPSSLFSLFSLFSLGDAYERRRRRRRSIRDVDVIIRKCRHLRSNESAQSFS